MFLRVRKSQNLHGEITMPRSKTHSFRALVLASLANGISRIRNPKISNDWSQAVKALRMYGAEIEEIEKDVWKIKGVEGKLETPNDVINVGNSGTMLFFLAGVAAACSGWSVITGDESIRNLRKISKNIFKPFRDLGVTIISTKDDGMAPLIIKGKVKGGYTKMDGKGCQPVFSILIASAFSPKPVEIFVKNPGETAYIELLLLWFRKVGFKFKNVDGRYEHFIFPGNIVPKAFEATIPYEWSAPPYPLLAAILTKNSQITVQGMDMADPFGDRFVINILQKMGADISVNNGTLTAKSSKLHGIDVDMNIMPDQVPTIAVAACFAEGRTIIKNALIARWKECDRIAAIFKELKTMGANIKEKRDGLIISQDGTWKLKGGYVSGHRDHRMVLSLAVAGLAVDGETIISDSEMVEKSFETFIPEMKRAGANFQLIDNI